MVNDVRGDLVDAFVNGGVVPAGDALLTDLVVADGQVRLWVVAFGAQDELVDEAVEELLELLWVVAAVDDVKIIVDGYLGA